MTRTEKRIVREALEQYVTNLGEMIDSMVPDAPAQDLANFETAEALLDQMNAEYLAELAQAN